jgi:hypothetical protein
VTSDYQATEVLWAFALPVLWEEIPRSALVGIVDTIRNRVLNMVLELKSEIGDNRVSGSN